MGWFNATEGQGRERGQLTANEAENTPTTPTTLTKHDWDYENIPLPAPIVSVENRLGLAPAQRIVVIGFASFVAGFGIFSAVGGTNAGLRFRAENAHNTPKSSQGWYLYSKSKNYHVMLGGLKEGVKGGVRFAGMTGVFLGLEEGLDRARGKIFASRIEKEEGLPARGQKDVLNTVSAAVASSGIYNWWRGHDRWTAMRMTRKGVLIAVPFGLMQDLFASLSGEAPWYVRKLGGLIGREVQPLQ